MRGSAGARLLIWAERLLLITGGVLLAWYAIVTVEQHVTQYFAHESLVAMPRVEPPPIDNSVARRPPPAAGTPLADLSIPRLHLSAVVLHGSDARTLRVGVGHIENTAFPGEPGNVAIAGHRDSFFRPLRGVRLGDEVLLDTPQGRVRYRVSSLRVVPPTEVSVLQPTRDATLTLVTCYPFWVLGHAPDRFIVRATRVSDGTPGTQPELVSAQDEIPARRVVSPAETARTASASARSRPTDAKGSGLASDEVLVRQAIERFRAVYNARFTRVGQERLEGPLTFTSCRIAVDGAHATATCQTPVGASDDLKVSARTFSLYRTGGVWAIRSFAIFP